MIVDVDLSSPVPPFEQVRHQIATLADSGALPVGARLPTIRQLARDLSLAPGTIARAYRELEAEGVVVSRVRHGTTVLPRPTRSPAQTRATLDAAAETLVQAARSLGVERDEALAAVSTAFDRAET